MVTLEEENLNGTVPPPRKLNIGGVISLAR